MICKNKNTGAFIRCFAFFLTFSYALSAQGVFMPSNQPAPNDVTIRLTQEEGTNRALARVEVFLEGVLVGTVAAFIEPKRGADGGFYNCVTLKEETVASSSS